MSGTATISGSTTRRAARPRPDSATLEAHDVARAALAELAAASDVGEHMGHQVEGDRVVTHFFDCALTGYKGWRWAVTVVRASRQKRVTVDEIALLPGEGAITAPEWVPYRERIKPGDLSPGDLLPVEDDDERLVPTYAVGEDEGLGSDDVAQIRDVAAELGLGRVRTLSVEGRQAAAERWYLGDGGPEGPLSASAPHTCWSCGFLVRLNGPLSECFGVCANGDANHDGRVVALEHGCGAHSEVKLAKKHEPQPLPDPVIDTITWDPSGIERF